MFDAVLLMAGLGKRSGFDINKVFYELEGLALYQHALKKFLSIKECKNVILVIQEKERHLLSHNEDKRIKIVIGGPTRQDSVFSGFSACYEDIVLVHDAARANPRVEDILKVYHETIKNKAAFLAVQVNDTIRECIDGYSVRTLDRQNLWQVQTPQGFYKDIYLDCGRRAKKDSFIATDDIGLLEKYSDIKAKLVVGAYSNIKLTTEIDFLIMKELMKERKL